MTKATGSPTQSEQADFFEAKIRPILVERCFKCHGPRKAEAGLRLDSREALLGERMPDPSLCRAILNKAR